MRRQVQAHMGLAAFLQDAVKDMYVFRGRLRAVPEIDSRLIGQM